MRPLASHFARRKIGANARPISFSREALWLLENYDWPGNIRELENAVVRAVALCDQIVRPEDLPEKVRRSFKYESDAVRTAAAGDAEEGLSLAELERRHILKVLTRTGGNKQAAARILGIDRTTLQRKLERYDLDKSEGQTLPFPQ